MVGEASLKLVVWVSTHFVLKTSHTSLSPLDVKQAAIDALLANSLSGGEPTIPSLSSPLPTPVLLEALARCSQHKFGQVTSLSPSTRIAAMLDCMLLRVDEEQAVSSYLNSHAPTRLIAEEEEGEMPEESFARRERVVWLQLWAKISLSDLPGFPAWEKQVGWLSGKGQLGEGKEGGEVGWVVEREWVYGGGEGGEGRRSLDGVLRRVCVGRR